MTDTAIKVGDVAIDLVKRGKVQIVGRVAKTVTEHRRRVDYDIAEYKANALLDVQDDQPVYSGVYLPDEPSTSFSGTYDFPASRLARVPVEEANEDLRRFQRDLVGDVLEALFRTAESDDMATTADAFYDVASHAGFPEDLVDEARELADVEQTIGSEDGGSDE